MRDICFSCDDNGAKFLRVTVWSRLKHYAGSEPLRINVFEGFGGHSADSKNKLQLKNSMNCEEKRWRKEVDSEMRTSFVHLHLLSFLFVTSMLNRLSCRMRT